VKGDKTLGIQCLSRPATQDQGERVIFDAGEALVQPKAPDL